MRRITILLTMLLVLVSCKSPSYLPKPKDFKYHTKGLYLETTLYDKHKVLGEIIEVNENEIKILPLNNMEGVQTISKDKIESAYIIVSLTSDDPKKVGNRALISTLTTAAHGLWMGITLPINLGVSISTAQGAAKGTYRIEYPADIDWTDISRFARFPQGIPENIDESLIK